MNGNNPVNHENSGPISPPTSSFHCLIASGPPTWVPRGPHAPTGLRWGSRFLQSRDPETSLSWPIRKSCPYDPQMHLTHGPLSPFSLPRPPPDTVTSFLSYFKCLQVGSPALGQALSSSLRNRSDQDTPLLSRNLSVHGVGITRRVGEGNEGGGEGKGFRKLHLGWRFVASGLGRRGIGLSGPPESSRLQDWHLQEPSPLSGSLTFSLEGTQRRLSLICYVPSSQELGGHFPSARSPKHL